VADATTHSSAIQRSEESFIREHSRLPVAGNTGNPLTL
jgi:hypothetical protein